MDFDATVDEERRCQALALGFEFVACMDFVTVCVVCDLYSCCFENQERPDELSFCCAWILKLLVMKKDDAKLWL
jgi:hypothetical protein